MQVTSIHTAGELRASCGQHTGSVTSMASRGDLGQFWFLGGPRYATDAGPVHRSLVYFNKNLDGRCAGGALDPRGKGEGRATCNRGLSKPELLRASHDSNGPLLRPAL